jgi:hypothetical protein
VKGFVYGNVDLHTLLGLRHEGCGWVLLRLSNLLIFMTCGLKEREIREI